MCKVPVVVIRSNDFCFLGILRSCGDEGIPVIPIVFSWDGAGEWFSEKSKYYINPVKVHNPAEDEKKSKEDILELGKALKKKYGTKILIIPSSDTSLIFLQKYIDEFKKYFYLMGHGDFDKDCLNELSKSEFARIMHRSGVPIPETYDVKSKDDLVSVGNKVSYPCVCKPIMKDIGNTFQRTHNQNKAIECRSSEDLTNRLNEELEKGYQFIVQEKIFMEGLEDEISIYAYADAAGKVTMLSGVYKIEEYPKPYGTAVVCKQYVKTELVPLAKKTMAALKWHGFVNIEFMRNSRNNQWVVIEVNLRPWLTNYLQSFLGFNYVASLYREIYLKESKGSDALISVNNEFLLFDTAKYIQMEIERNENIKEAVEKVEKVIQSNVGKCLFLYYLLDDELPGLAEKEIMIEKYGNRQLFEHLYDVMDLNNKELKENKKIFNLARRLNV